MLFGSRLRCAASAFGLLAGFVAAPANANAAGVGLYNAMGNQVLIETLEDAGADPVVELDALAGLDDFELVMVIGLPAGLPDEERAALVAYAQDPSHTLFLAGDWPMHWEAFNAEINLVLDDLGVSDRVRIQPRTTIGTAGTCGYPEQDPPADHPLMQGVARLKGSVSAVLDADPDTVLLNREGGPTIAVVDNIVVTSDSDVVMDFVDLNGIRACALLEGENLQFIRNLYQVDLSPSPPDGGDSGGGGSTGGGASTETGATPEDTATSTGGDGTESGDVEGSTGDTVGGSTSGSVDPGEDTDGPRATAEGSGRGCRAGGEAPPYLAALGLLVAVGWRRRSETTC